MIFFKEIESTFIINSYKMYLFYISKNYLLLN